MHISDLPPELHTQIIDFACEGIPSVGEQSIVQALSLVSSYWYAVVTPFRYQSLRVSGGQAIVRLGTLFSTLPERERRVRYLALSDKPVDACMDDESFHQLKASISQLLALLTPSLYALALELSNPFYGTSMFSVLWMSSAPCLESLSIKGYYPFPTAPMRSSRSNFPRLEHLSLDGSANPAGLLSYRSLEAVFPRLETLEVRGIRSAYSFSREVQHAFEELDKRSDHTNLCSRKDPYHSRFPRTLKLLSIYPSPESSIKSYKRGQTLHFDMLKVFMDLANREEKLGGPRVRVVIDGLFTYKDVVPPPLFTSLTDCGVNGVNSRTVAVA
ncbi:uncharacterized protein FOMMEDRAFT_120286 [Fomitiporia mediterranea MF3/22]|uniref:uncharacterized protein n=1 Tax=Fomitiporia mediterranea (strain MF3/22) TaxID=694068 RepID=UPI000440978C|nr:uncharacterized protein FOMMEDRAFT_120286 [Fomitiporia mediterranea MF3/22]EJD05015.1 hypothetical protein FOMMEDRAFT_120286 [Fomitiporia mediterranea MF3/22]